MPETMAFALTLGPAGALGEAGDGAARGLAALLFDAGAAARAQDPVQRFLREEAPALDWRTDFLRSAFIELIFAPPEPDDEEEEPEDFYSKDAIVITGQGALDADAS